MTTVAVTDYSSLGAGINDFATRSYDSGQLDRFIALAEAEFRLYFGPNFAKETSTTLSFTDGSASLPAGFVRFIALTHSTYGGLTETSIGAVREARISNSGIPARVAVTGSTLELDTEFTGDMTLDYEGTLAGLTNSNATNWLILNAPQAYLSMCLAMEKAYLEKWDASAMLKANALQTLNDLGFQSMVAQLGRSTVRIPGATP